MEQPFKLFKKLVVPLNQEDARRYLAEKNGERAKVNKPATSKPISIPNRSIVSDTTTSTMQTLEASASISLSMSTTTTTVVTTTASSSIEGFLETTGDVRNIPDKDNIQAGINQILLTLQDIQLNPNTRRSKQSTTSATIAEIKG